MNRTLFSLLVASTWLTPASAQTPAAPPPATAAAKPAPDTLASDTPRTTAGGATFTAPREWSITVDGATPHAFVAAAGPATWGDQSAVTDAASH